MKAPDVITYWWKRCKQAEYNYAALSDRYELLETHLRLCSERAEAAEEALRAACENCGRVRNTPA